MVILPAGKSEDTLDAPGFSIPTVKGQGYCISAIIEPNGEGEDSISIHLKFREARMKLDETRHNQQASEWLSALVNSAKQRQRGIETE
ncbi:hypothetical protein RJZ90_001178 [Blastomyces dermatitidis]